MTALPRHQAKAGEDILSSPPFGNSQEQTTKVAVIRQEFVDLTGDPLIAVVLNQLVYWTQRVKDFDLLLEEENTQECKQSQSYGWFYKSAKGLTEETMICVSKVTMLRYLNFLITRGWLFERENPQNKWDRTTQYRLNLRQLQIDLKALGWALPGFPTIKGLPQVSKVNFHNIKSENLNKTGGSKNETSKFQKSTFEGKASEPSKVKKCNFIYLTETTSKTTNKEHTPLIRKSASAQCEESVLEMIELWKKYVGQEEILLNSKRIRQFKSLITLHFGEDLPRWEAFCKRVQSSPFLMGKGPKQWRVSFDWILRGDNILKILEGNYDNPEHIQQKKESQAETIRREKAREILDSIEDPQWREWCSQLSEFPPHGYLIVNKPLSWWQLERITNAKFIDFDERLVVIGSTDPKVLNEIEDNRFQLACIVSRTFPTSRTIRTQLLTTETYSSPKASI